MLLLVLSLSMLSLDYTCAQHYDKLELVAETLIKKEKISGKEFENLMKSGTLEVEAVETSTDELTQEQAETENE